MSSPEQLTPGTLVEVPECPHATKRPLPRDWAQMVRVVIGPASNSSLDTAEPAFSIHRGLLTHYSSHFALAINGLRKLVIRCPNGDPVMFEAFFQWLYTGKLYVSLNAEGKIPLTPLRICEIFIFGHSLGAPELCNAAMDLFFQKYVQDWKFWNRLLSIIYYRTPVDSPLRLLSVHEYSRMHGREREDWDQFRKYPHPFRASVLAYMSTLGLASYYSGNASAYIKQRRLELCQYHDHSRSNTTAMAGFPPVILEPIPTFVPGASDSWSVESEPSSCCCSSPSIEPEPSSSPSIEPEPSSSPSIEPEPSGSPTVMPGPILFEPLPPFATGPSSFPPVEPEPIPTFATGPSIFPSVESEPMYYLYEYYVPDALRDRM